MQNKTFFLLTETCIAPIPDNHSIEDGRRMFGPTAHINADGKFQFSHIAAVSTDAERVAVALDFSDRKRLGKLTPEEQAQWDKAKEGLPPLDSLGTEPEFILSVEEFRDFEPIGKRLIQEGRVHSRFIKTIEKELMDTGIAFTLKYELISTLFGGLIDGNYPDNNGGTDADDDGNYYEGY